MSYVVRKTRPLRTVSVTGRRIETVAFLLCGRFAPTNSCAVLSVLLSKAVTKIVSVIRGIFHRGMLFWVTVKSLGWRLLLVLSLLGPLIGLVPLAYASPPDPAWISGLYDDADYDDVVVVATSIKAPEEPAPLLVIAPVTILLAVLCVTEAASSLSVALLASQTRAPPTP